METAPGSSLEVVEAKFLLQLLMRVARTMTTNVGFASRSGPADRGASLGGPVSGPKISLVKNTRISKSKLTFFQEMSI